MKCRVYLVDVYAFMDQSVPQCLLMHNVKYSCKIVTYVYQWRLFYTNGMLCRHDNPALNSARSCCFWFKIKIWNCSFRSSRIRRTSGTVSGMLHKTLGWYPFSGHKPNSYHIYCFNKCTINIRRCVFKVNATCFGTDAPPSGNHSLNSNIKAKNLKSGQTVPALSTSSLKEELLQLFKNIVACTICQLTSQNGVKINIARWLNTRPEYSTSTVWKRQCLMYVYFELYNMTHLYNTSNYI